MSMLLGELRRRLLTFLLVAGLGWFAWGMLEAPFTRGFCALSEVVFSNLTFGKGGHVAVEFAPQPAAAAASTETADSWNTRLRLRVDGIDKEHAIRVNPRRLAYLPLLFFTALLAALPLPIRSRAICAAIGGATLLLAALAAVWTSAAWIFARVPGLVYDFSAWQQSLLHFAYEGLVTPLGNKLILPLLIGGALFLWQTRRLTQLPQQA